MRSESESEFDELHDARAAYPASPYDAPPAYQPSYDNSYPASPSYGGYGMIEHISKA